MAKRGALTPMQQKFAHEYCVDQNITQAAIRAGYSEAGAHVAGWNALRNSKVRDLIQAELNRAMNDRRIRIRTVVNRLDDIAAFDPLELVDPETNKMLHLRDIPLEIRRCIKDISVKEELLEGVPIAEITKITFHDRVKANELLGKFLKMFSEEIEVKHTHTLESLVAGTPERDVTMTPTQLIEEAGHED